MKISEILFMTVILFIILTGLCMFHPTYGKDLGVMGETYPIMEMNFLDFIQSRATKILQTGEWKMIQENAEQKAKKLRDRPHPVEGISRTTDAKSWYFDPSIVLDNDIKSYDGKVIALKGTRVNPLVYISLSKVLLFYNSDGPVQIRWAKTQDKKFNGKTKLILINGSILNQEKQLKKVIYFDQEGKLTTHFGIKHVPAMVLQDGLKLTILEVVP